MWVSGFTGNEDFVISEPADMGDDIEEGLTTGTAPSHQVAMFDLPRVATLAKS